jgi:glycosyltransferase involved in cell wall biosynthesis
LKIAILRRCYITYVDGVNNFIFSLAAGLESLGHCVHAISWSFNGVEKPENLTEWAQKTYGAKTNITTIKDRPTESTPWTRIGWDWATKGSKILKDLDPDTVIINGIIPLRFNGKKIVVNHGIYEMSSNRMRKAIARYLYKKCIRICVSNKLAQEYSNFFGLDSQVIPLPLRLKTFKPHSFDERENIVLHIGTRPIKNLNVSIEAVKMLTKKHVRSRLIVVGPKCNDSENLVERARKCRIDIETKYSIPLRELADLYGKAKALILPSKYEALSYVTIESMASGTPVVVSKEIPTDVVSNGHNGFRIDTYNPADYAEALAILLKDQKLWTRLSENAISSVTRFDHTEIAEKYIELMTHGSSTAK